MQPAPLPSESVLQEGQVVIPDHRLLCQIGRGAYGDVWLARNVFGELRAVKLIYRNRFSDPRPFEREFEGIRRFEPISRSHPSQLSILHVGQNEDGFYYVMELADPATDTKSELRNPNTDVSPYGIGGSACSSSFETADSAVASDFSI